MPYIHPDARPKIGGTRGHIDVCASIVTPGELTFVLTTAVNQYAQLHGLTFQVIAEVLGALSATKSEFYRRVVVPYEDEARIRNGDVYPDELLPRQDQ